MTSVLSRCPALQFHFKILQQKTKHSAVDHVGDVHFTALNVLDAMTRGNRDDEHTFEVSCTAGNTNLQKNLEE
jgi:hypothetical protein